MDITNGIIITINNKKYIILETLIYENKAYVFTNEIKNEEELTEDYYIFKIEESTAEKVIDEELMNTLLPKFQEKLKTTIETNL